MTEVTTDIVFFQKNTGEKLRSKDWLFTQDIECPDLNTGVARMGSINKYLADRPDCDIRYWGSNGPKVFCVYGMYRNSIGCVVPEHMKEGFDLGKEISDRLHILPQNAFTPAEKQEETLQEKRNADFIDSAYFKELKMGALCVEPRTQKILFKTAGDFGQSSYDYALVKNDTARQRITHMVQIRDTLRKLLNLEKHQEEDVLIEVLRGRLNTQYDAFVRKCGHLNSQTNRSLMRQDPESSLIESLEMEYDKGLSAKHNESGELAAKQGKEPRRASAKKAAIFTKRVLKPTATVETAETAPKDSYVTLIISLRESGKVDFQRMSKLLRTEPEKIQQELQQQELIYLNPQGETWEIRDKYLTGNIRKKLNMAEFFAENDERYSANVEALRKAMPPFKQRALRPWT